MSEVGPFDAKNVTPKTLKKYVEKKQQAQRQNSQLLATLSKDKMAKIESKGNNQAKDDEGGKTTKGGCCRWKGWSKYAAEHVNSITFEDIEQSGVGTAFGPILVCFLFVLYTLNTFPYFQATFNLFSMSEFVDHLLPSDRVVPNNQDKVPAGEPIMHFEPEPEPMPVWVIAIVVLVLLVVLALLTFGMVLLYKKGWYRVIHGLFIVAFLFYLGVFPVIWMQEFVYHYNIATDWLVFTFTLFNYLGLGMMCLFGQGPRPIKKLYNILTCVIVVFFLVKWCTIWVEVALLLAVVLWDLFAVLHQSGPLNQLIDHMKTNKIDMPPIVFETMVWLMAQVTPKTTEAVSQRPAAKLQGISSIISDDNELQIGLGDFVFYSLLVGKSFLYANFLGACLTAVALFFGLSVTILLLMACDHALPALPIPILLGLFTQILSQFCVDPFATRLNAQIVVI